jgi:hypothetical protein
MTTARSESVRELIEDMRRELRDDDVPPQRAAEILQRLTALLGNVLQEIREADMAYNRVLLGYLDSEMKANRAKIHAETTPEYARAKEAKDTNTVLLEMIRSLKVVLKTQAEEMRLSR